MSDRMIGFYIEAQREYARAAQRHRILADNITGTWRHNFHRQQQARYLEKSQAAMMRLEMEIGL